MKKFIPFILSLNLSLMVFLIPWGFCFYPHKEAEVVENPVIIPPPAEMLICIEEKEPLLFLHLKVELNSCTIMPLNTNVRACDTDGRLPLSDIYKNGGAKYCSKALNKSFGYNIESYTSCNINSLSKLLKPLGSCDFILTSPVITKDGDILFNEGRNLLNIEDAVLILKYAHNLSEAERNFYFSSILSEIFNQRGNLSEKSIEKLFNFLSDSPGSSLSVNDLLSSKKYRLFKEGFKFHITCRK